MSEITPKCAGCARLMTPGDPLCIRCVNQSNYRVRGYSLGVDKEMKMLGIEPPRIVRREYITTTGTSNSKDLLNKMYGTGIWAKNNPYITSFTTKENAMKLPKIEKVIFNKPATIVVWGDGSKTVVKCEGEAFDEEKGLAMAIAKKALGNQGNYYETFKKWLPKDLKVKPITPVVNVNISGQEIGDKQDDNPTNDFIVYDGHKKTCKHDCYHCCPAIMNNRSYAAKVCKEQCNNYKKHYFGDVSK